MTFACMELDGGFSSIDDLFINESETRLKTLASLKIAVICNDKQKATYIDMGIIPRLLSWMSDESNEIELRTEAANLMGSLSRGPLKYIKSILDAGALPVLLAGVRQENLPYTEACLRCVRTLLSHSDVDTGHICSDSQLILHLIQIMPRSSWTRECVATVLCRGCKKYEHQVTLCNNGAIPTLAALLSSHQPRVLLPALTCLSTLSYRNEHVGFAMKSTNHNGELLTTVIANFLAGDKQPDLRLTAAKCLTYLYRCCAHCKDLPLVKFSIIPVLVRLCKSEFTIDQNIEAATTLAYLIEDSSELQIIASITDHCISTIAKFLVKSRENVERRDDLLHAAFLLFAALSSNDEDIRKKVIVVTDLMSHAIDSIVTNNDKVKVAALRCLHSLSRSVQQLRTSFHNIHAPTLKALLKLTKSTNLDVVLTSTALLCNLLLEFSPTKSVLIEAGAVDHLAAQSLHINADVRLNVMWAFMNMSFQAKEMLKMTVMQAILSDRIYQFIYDECTDVALKTLAMFTNVLSFRHHIDQVMQIYGSEIMLVVVFALEADRDQRVKEQTLCVLGNIAEGGNSAKEYIMGNEDVVKKLLSYLMCSNENIQLAATVCITNLIWNGDDGFHVRQSKLRDLGVHRMLHQLQSTTNTSSLLYEKVLKALQQFAS